MDLVEVMLPIFWDFLKRRKNQIAQVGKKHMLDKRRIYTSYPEGRYMVFEKRREYED